MTWVPGGGHEPAADPDAEVHAVGDRRRRQPRREPELVEPVQLADVDREEPRTSAGYGRKLARSTHIRTICGPGSSGSGLDGLDRLRQHGDVRRSWSDDVAEDGLDAVGAAHDEQRLGGQPGVLEGQRDEPVAVEGAAPAGLRELAVLEVADRVRRRGAGRPRGRSGAGSGR
jgi:hypothetical protein